MEIWKIYIIVFTINIRTSYCYDAKTNHCTFKHKKRNATCAFLNYIPKLPDSVTILNLQNNILPNISKETFQNLSANRIVHLNFRKNNSIRSLAKDSFKDLIYLETLELSNEKNIDLNSLEESFHSLNRSNIRDLRLQDNGWKSLPNDFFYPLNRLNMSTISLNGNQFILFNATFMRHFANVKRLRMESNEIVFVYPSGLNCLQHLIITANNIFEIPSFCDNKTGGTLVPRLTALTIIDNAIRKLNQDSFKCLYKLEKLILDRNRIQTLEDNVFLRLSNLKRLSLNLNPQIRKIMPLAFNSSSLTVLQFVQNGFRFDKLFYQCKKVFKYTPNLGKLDLTRNYLPNDPNKILKMFYNLTTLTELRLETTSITHLPVGLFQRMPFLETLHLKGNRISRWNRSVFENLTSLKNLYMDGNYIRIINETSFPKQLLSTLKKIDLSNNEYLCTCSLKWFVDFLRASNITKNKVLMNWPWRYACVYPENKRRLWLSEYKPTDAQCSEWSPFFTIIILTASSCFLLVVVLIVMYRCQPNIRNLVYLFRVHHQKRRGYLRFNSSEDFEFDAFVVYCDADRTWVHDVLLKRLENHNLKVCVHHRDFDIGEAITDNIERYISKSWKVIVVMSNNFTKSEWCQWELDLVQERRRRHGREAIVLIMYSQIDSSHMTSSVTSLLDTTPHLKYKTGLGEELFWKVVVQTVTKPFSEPPISIL